MLLVAAIDTLKPLESLAYEPAAAWKHSPAAVELEKEPCGHHVHSEDPTAALKEPMGQGTHSLTEELR